MILNNNYKNLLATFFILISFFTGKELYATHAMAVDISYECVGPNKYYFCVNFYRDCDGTIAPSS